MFRKKVESCGQHVLSAKDRKRLLAAMSLDFSPGEVEKLFEAWPHVVVTRLKGVKTVVYSREDEAVLFAVEGNAVPLPTLATLTRQPQLLLRQMIISPGVEEFLARGANLMWPGVAGVTPHIDFPSGVPAAAFTTEGLPVAVGLTTEAADRTQGVAMLTLHHISDELSKQTRPQLDSASEEEEQTVDERVATPAEVDANLREAFLNCVHLSLREDGFIESGLLWRKHIVACRAPGAIVDLRQSSFKSLSAFLKALEAEGLIIYSAGSKKSPPGVSHVRREAPAIREHRPTVTLAPKEDKPVCKTRFEISNWVTMPPKLAAVLKAESGVMRRAEFRALIEQHLRRKRALKGQNLRSVEVGAELVAGVEGQSPPATLSELLAAVEKTCVVSQLVKDTVTGGERHGTGAFEGLELVSEKRVNHFCTKIRGLEHWGVAPPTAVAELQRVFDTGITVHKSANSAEIILQGTFIAPMKAALHRLFGIDEDCIVVFDKAKRVLKNHTKH